MPAWESETHFLVPFTFSGQNRVVLRISMRPRVEFYAFLRGTMAWTASIAWLWPLNIPLAALAYKIRQGPNPVDMEKKELWLRSTFAALSVALLTVAAFFADYILAEVIAFPAGPVHLVVFMGYVPLVLWVLLVFFALEDLLQALAVFVLYLYLPVMALYALNAMVHFWDPWLEWVEQWLKPIV
jgi:hypothetical protein